MSCWGVELNIQLSLIGTDISWVYRGFSLNLTTTWFVQVYVELKVSHDRVVLKMIISQHVMEMCGMLVSVSAQHQGDCGFDPHGRLPTQQWKNEYNLPTCQARGILDWEIGVCRSRTINWWSRVLPVHVKEHSILIAKSSGLPRGDWT